MAEIHESTQEGDVIGFWHRYRLLIIVTVIGLTIAASLVGWLALSKDSAVKQAEEAAAIKHAEWVKQSDARQAGMVKQSLIQFGVPLAWAVRREMMANNLDQIDQYVTDLVKMEGIRQVTVAKQDGSVVMASDRKNIGIRFDSLYDGRYLTVEQIVADELSAGQWFLVVPVMGLNARLGTVVIEYQSPSLEHGG